MNHIGKILPIEGYRVLFKGNLPVDYAKSLTHLYQPLIGIQAYSLYQTLMNELEFQHESVQTHHTIMNYMNLPLDDIYRARLKLEGIGLLKTYQNQTDEQNSYIYELQSPFSPANFFTDEMLAQLLYHHIGETKFELLKEHYTQHEKREGTNITASFSEVFQTFQPYLEGMEVAKDQHESITDSAAIDFTWMEQMLKQRMIPANRVLTPANKKLISQMMTLYDLATYEVEKSVLWALTDENTLNRNEFKEACHDLFKNKHNQINIKLTEKEEHPINEKPVSNPTTKEEQLIIELEKISPKQLLEDLSSGGQASAQDMKVIREVMTTQGLPSPVMNVLIHYVLLQSNMKLSRAYLEKIASHWSRANLKTAKEAMAFAKSEKDRYQKGKANKPNYKKPQSNEVVPDWFKERKKKKQQTNSTQDNTDSQQEWEETATLLRKYSKKKNNHL
ncbi:replication initiation and membrane attachment family protein [Virgibacillus litoralis]|uniref:Replication initiation and membrane attachment protein n=1 Tax=Virgibacillus litoralis TaxID=578221 RepID=A0ABS4HA13_9BACI|nr:DnaD domain protein [Virgibacillus litoralis]MBP1947750.1 replication initiation and membrane attachment protein [Virgibacillus litoralis]